MPVVLVNRKKFTITDQEAIVMSGDELLALFGVPPTHDLWTVDAESGSEFAVSEYDVLTDLTGRKFFTAPKRINGS